jgi:hypothetical protein
MVYNVKPVEHVRCAITADGGTLLDLTAGRFFRLNHVGSMIWSQLEQGRQREEIVAFLYRDFADVPRHQIAEDVDRFISGLVQKGFVDLV